MEKYNIYIEKMKTDYQDSMAQYFLVTDIGEINVNTYLEKSFTFSFNNIINCVSCQAQIKKSYSNGYCYKCLMTLPECDSCIIKPELCHFSRGTCRDPKWGESHCMKTHIVYLANTSGLKIGITRQTRVPHRWIDQGAIQAIPIYKVNSRPQSGILEVAHKESLNDKTDWRKMLKNEVDPLDLEYERDEVYFKYESVLEDFVQEFGEDSLEVLEDEKPLLIKYPVISYPKKIKNPFKLEKVSKFEGTLLGIKGQYLIFDTGFLNVRAHSGYNVTVTVND